MSEALWALLPVSLYLGALALFLPGGIVSQGRWRVGSAKPVVLLVCEMLQSDIGWSGRDSYPRHATGVEVDSYRANCTRLRIGGDDAPLSSRDKFLLHRAVKGWAKRQSRREADQAAIELSRKVKDMAERVQAMAENVVPIRTKREDAA